MTNKIAYTLLLVFAFAMRALAATPNVAYVAYNGLDTHPCSRSAPCQTITHALAIVSTGGIVSIVGSGGYDAFTVTRAVTVEAEPGVVASIDVPASGTGVTVNAASTDLVTLRSITLHGSAGTGTGFQINSVGRLTVEDCVSRNLTYGLAYVASTGGELVVNGGTFEGSDTGLYIVSTGAAAAIDRVTVFGGSHHAGIDAAANIVTVTNSLITDDGGAGANQGEGVQIDGGTVVLENDVISHFTSGVRNFGTVYLSSCNITENIQGVWTFNSSAFSRGNNSIVTNGSDVVGTLTPFSAQ